MMTYTEAMFKSNSPFDNPFQGKDRRVLFVCSAGLLRSPTGARLYAQKYNTRAAGSADYALIPVTHDLLLWAQEVVFVDKENREAVHERFDLTEFPCKIVVLDIPDQYEHMHPELVKAFKEQYEDC